MQRGFNRHHILFNKREWESRPQYKSLRENTGLIVPMDNEVHNELHRAVPFVPLLGYHGIVAVQREFYRGRSHLESVDNLLFAIQESMRHPRETEIEKRLSGIALDTIEQQRPYILKGEVK